MKNTIRYLFASVLVPLALGLLPGCGSLSQNAAVTVYDAGYATANDILNHDATLGPIIDDVAAKLPLLNTGQLSDNDLGKLGGELKLLKDNFGLLKNLFPADSAKLDKANVLVSGWISGQGKANGGVTALPGIVADGVLQQFSSGLTGGEKYWAGFHGVTHP